MKNLIIIKKQVSQLSRSIDGGPIIKFWNIPSYQRKYSWTEDQIEPLLNDIETNRKNFFNSSKIDEISKKTNANVLGWDLQKNNVQQIYVGNIVLSANVSDTTKYEIIDGQQRISTIFIILKIMLAIFEKKHKSEFVIKDHLIMRFKPMIELTKELVRPRDNNFEEKPPVSSDNETDQKALDIFFNTMSIDSVMHKMPKKSQYLKNIVFIYGKFENLSIEDLLSTWFTILSMELGVIISDEDRAYELFEVLNSRGMDLTQADLLKNLFYKNEPQNKVEITKKWKLIEENLPPENPAPNAMTNFLRWAYIAMKMEYVPKKKLFEQISKSDKTQYSGLLQTFVEYSVLLKNWTEAEEISDSLLANKKHVIKRAMKKIASIYKPLLVYLFANCDASCVCNALIYLEKQTFLHFTVNNLPSKELDKEVPAIIKKINSLTERNWEAIKKIFDEKIKPHTLRGNESFDLLKRLLQPDFIVKRDLFIQIMELISNFADDSETLLYNWAGLQMEHLLPETSTLWVNAGHVTNEELKYKNLIGNLFPVQSKINASISNKIYSEKINDQNAITEENGNKKSLRNSILFEEQMKNSFGAIPNEWNVAKIKTRTRHLIKMLLTQAIPWFESEENINNWKIEIDESFK